MGNNHAATTDFASSRIEISLRNPITRTDTAGFSGTGFLIDGYEAYPKLLPPAARRAGTGPVRSQG